ncbi:Uncharacterised protein [Kingella potus]|uniref:FG-GAP repeat n=1 Tax=Kingella potus TaxID=265175 RepID=A0A377R5F4_9NEIS|nr:hypothetical protein [Kingella potus]UOP00164.1 hypothetical protein LVJ84_09455 [Kingella potus]STR02775.1 Uncharacterised protein [Kingella potus]
MRRLSAACLIFAAANAFADTPVATYSVPTPAGFPFAVETQVLSDNGYQVKITDRETGKVQVIEDIVDFPVLKEKIRDLVAIRDYNGDGRPDIAVRIVGAYTLSADELYLFNPATRQFKEVPYDNPDKVIAFVGNVEVIRKGCIRVEHRISIRDYGHEDYCWKNGGWQEIKAAKAKQGGKGRKSK